MGGGGGSWIFVGGARSRRPLNSEGESVFTGFDDLLKV